MGVRLNNSSTDSYRFSRPFLAVGQLKTSILNVHFSPISLQQISCQLVVGKPFRGQLPPRSNPELLLRTQETTHLQFLTKLSLTFCHWNLVKNLKQLLLRGHLQRLANRRSGERVICHDIISNRVSPKGSINFTTLTLSELVQVLSRQKKRLARVLYVQRTRVIDIFSELKKAGVLKNDFKRQLLSKRTQRSEVIWRNLKTLHPTSFFELNFAATPLLCEDDRTKNSRKENKQWNKKNSQ